MTRLYAKELAAFKEAAIVCGIDTSSWVRERLRDAAIRDLVSHNRPVPFLLPDASPDQDQ